MSKTLLAITELGGYPNLLPLYQRLGYSVEFANSQRKAMQLLKKHMPDVIVAEYNYQTDFRDRSSNLETLCSLLPKYPGTHLLVFYQPKDEDRFKQFRQQHLVWQALAHPILPEQVESALKML